MRDRKSVHCWLVDCAYSGPVRVVVEGNTKRRAHGGKYPKREEKPVRLSTFALCGPGINSRTRIYAIYIIYDNVLIRNLVVEVDLAIYHLVVEVDLVI